jgi:uncharacterized protein YceK
MKNIFLSIITIVALTGCTTVLNKYTSNEKYLMFKSSHIPQSVFMIKTDKTGKRWGELSSPLLFKSTFTGSIEIADNGDITFNIENIDFFANWHNGWTQGKAQAIGKLLLKNTSDGFKCQIIDNIEIWDVTEGKIKYYDDSYINDEGLELVRNRIERIKALTEFLKTQKQLPEFFGHTFINTQYGLPIKKVLVPLLFPEMAEDSPQNYEEIIDSKDQSNDKNKISNNWSLGNDLLWNKKYTSKIFPERLQAIRNSGTMWRDYEEAAGLIMMFYNFDYYINKKLPEEIFKQIK